MPQHHKTYKGRRDSPGRDSRERHRHRSRSRSRSPPPGRRWSPRRPGDRGLRSPPRRTSPPPKPRRRSRSPRPSSRADPARGPQAGPARKPLAVLQPDQPGEARAPGRRPQRSPSLKRSELPKDDSRERNAHRRREIGAPAPSARHRGPEIPAWLRWDPAERKWVRRDPSQGGRESVIRRAPPRKAPSPPAAPGAFLEATWDAPLPCQRAASTPQARALTAADNFPPSPGIRRSEPGGRHP